MCVLGGGRLVDWSLTGRYHGELDTFAGVVVLIRRHTEPLPCAHTQVGTAMVQFTAPHCLPLTSSYSLTAVCDFTH